MLNWKAEEEHSTESNTKVIWQNVGCTRLEKTILDSALPRNSQQNSTIS